jgi:two-component system NtrC family sensor kinase
VSIRLKLTIWFVVVVLVANGLLSLTIILSLERMYLQEVQNRVRLDLISVRSLYDHQAGDIAALLRAVSVRRSFTSPLAVEVQDGLGKVLEEIRREGALDMLTLVDAGGRVVHRAHNPGEAGDLLTAIPIVASAVAEGAAARGTFIVPAAVLERDGEALARRARFEIDGRGAPRGGMAVGAAVPFVSAGEVLGVLFGAKLLNRRNDFVDTLQTVEYRPHVFAGKDVVTATIFQGDVRIATSARGASGERSVGTRLGERARRTVLGGGQTWGDRAYIADDWYFAAYEPIHDPSGEIIGALGVALLEAPFTEPQKGYRTFFLVTTTAASLATLALLFLLTRALLNPIAYVVRMCRRVAAGDLNARVEIRPSGEMGILCSTIDRMADAIAAREQKLRKTTQRQISRSEKLASIGRLAAGIAHEINNPLTGILMFAHILQEREGRDDQDQRDIRVIVDETTRVSGIVRSLLDFARESAPSKTLLDLNDVVQEVIQLARVEVAAHEIVIMQELAARLPPILGDRDQLKQVFLNLMLNAIEAMPTGGTLSFRSATRNGEVVVQVTDNGCGIPADHMDRIIDPFFTTKPVGKGTGLGLSVSYGILQQHGGSLEVESEENVGTTVLVVIPVHRKDEKEASSA